MKRAIALAAAGLIAVSTLTFSALAEAQSLKISTGDSKSGSTYSRMFRELAAKCREVGDINLVEFESSGSLQNVDRLVANEAQGAIVQTDVIYLQARTDDRLNNIKTLFTLFPEEVHIVTKTDLKVGGKFGFGGELIRDVSQLAGLKVGAAGGSVMTAKVLQFVGEVQMNVVEYGSTAAALTGLAKGEVQAVVAVGGAPLGSVEALGPEYRLVPFSENLIGKLKQVYVPAKLNYRKMSASTGVSTVATEAILVVQNYKSPKVVASLAAMRSCISKSIEDLRDEPGTHAKWKTVDLTNRGKWIWYDLPTIAKK